ncbi:hypothetical protein N0V84_012046 [Fusarium piperis]|uniref:Protein kinase domain-containing protein n=1 Tax=Fusarium piperis TaxID=1435070 RepID=A0A9W8TC80_9HYPO|nr:hypothetical protein N0V84_012046 [Fusarium piperis]
MSNSDIIALIYPHVDAFGAATRAIQASPFYNPPLMDPSQSSYDRDGDDSTQISNRLNVRLEDTLPFAKITFGYAPKTNRGILIGSSPSCDLVVREKGVSLSQISLTFDKEKRPIIRDWGSLTGIQVTYDGEGAGKRSKFQWIVGGNKIPDSKISIILELHKTISFRIIIPCHDISCPEYIEKVDRFCRGTASPEDLLEDLDLISRPGTMFPTGVNTPGTGDIYLKKRLGEGSFGEVTHLWNVSTGQDYALKTPSERAMRGRDVNIEAWRREARIMGQPHIIALLKESFTPKPQLFLEYMPGGSLQDHAGITSTETLTILRQCLSALDYLHGRDPPIAHRDIKPANILVKRRTKTFIYVKLGDFGVAGESSELMTMCGTEKYMAPEIHQEKVQRTGRKRKRGYNETADIWSLGMVASDGQELAYFLENYSSDYFNSLFVGSTLAELGDKEEATDFESSGSASSSVCPSTPKSEDEAPSPRTTGQQDEAPLPRIMEQQDLGEELG